MAHSLQHHSPAQFIGLQTARTRNHLAKRKNREQTNFVGGLNLGADQTRLDSIHGPERDAIDLLKACFPGGSITGAPKVRAMEIIAELEGSDRGPYCDAIGYMGFDGAMDTSIAIRTMSVVGEGSKRRAVFPVGGGIVADSDPEAEYEENLLKAQAFFDAVFAAATEAGARELKKPENVFWGGYSGYFADPDGHAWEVAWNPFFEIKDDGTIKLPE